MLSISLRWAGANTFSRALQLITEKMLKVMSIIRHTL